VTRADQRRTDLAAPYASTGLDSVADAKLVIYPGVTARLATLTDWEIDVQGGRPKRWRVGWP
jgi:hypothetical protein